MRRIWITVPWLLWSSLPLQVHALDLKQAYALAVRYEPQYKAAISDVAVTAEAYPQALSQLLPNVSFSASRNNVNLNRVDQGISSPLTYQSLNNTIVLRQPIYRQPQFNQYQQSKRQFESLGSAEAKAEADLAMRVCSAYFDALYAVDVLDQTQALLNASEAQVLAAQRMFATGQGTRTDTDEAQARFDQAKAQLLQAKQNRTYTQQQLSLLVGEDVQHITTLAPDRLTVFNPQLDATHWLNQALSANPELLLAKTKVEMAELEVSKNWAGHLPTLDLIAQRSISKSENTQFPLTDYYTSQVGVQLNLPLFAGGSVSSSTRQAVANLERERNTLTQMQNDLTLKVQKEHNNLTEGFERIKALEQSLLSANQLVISSTKGIQAGTRTLNDKLNAIQKQAEARRDLAMARYQYVLSIVKLSLLAAVDRQAVMDEANRYLSDAP